MLDGRMAGWLYILSIPLDHSLVGIVLDGSFNVYAAYLLMTIPLRVPRCSAGGRSQYRSGTTNLSCSR